MTNVTQHPVRSNSQSVPRLDLKRFPGTYLVTTSDGCERRVKMISTPVEVGEKPTSSQALVLVSYTPYGVAEFTTTTEPMIVHSIVELGRPWNLGKDDDPKILVASIVPVATVDA